MSFVLSGYQLPAPGVLGQVLTSDGLSWISGNAGGYTSISSNTIATAGSSYLCDTSTASFTLTLPTSPTINNTVTIQDAKGTFSTNNLIVDPGSKTIMGESGTLMAAQSSVGFGLIYNGTEWRIF